MALVGLVAGGGSAAAASVRYAVVPAPYRAAVRFAVTYSGFGAWHTVYHSTPANPGGASDTNDARDSSTQRWSLSFGRLPAVGPCDRPSACDRSIVLSSATGPTNATGTIYHRHLDGLYSADDVAVACTVAAQTSSRGRVAATIEVRELSGGLELGAFVPVAKALLLLPSECPGQGDPVDGLANNYFTPGFSFAAGYGVARWFTSQRVEIPARALHRAARIRIRLSGTARGTPPSDCGVHRADERCTTGGSWLGVLTLSLRK